MARVPMSMPIKMFRINFKNHLLLNIKVLENINRVNIESLYTGNPPSKDLFNLVSYKDLLRLASMKLHKNRGAITPRTEGSTADNVS